MTFSVYSDEHFMREALKQAHIALTEGEVPVGAIIVCQNKIIARAYNQVERLQDVTAHAEMLAITAASNYLGAKYLPECTLYVTLEPCVMCGGASSWAQVGTLVYGASDPDRGFSRMQKGILHPKTKVKSGLLQKECSQLVTDFFESLRRNKNS